MAILTNGETGRHLIDDLLDPLLSELADVAPAPPPSPAGAARVPEPGRYLGRYQTRIDHNDVTVDDDGRLWLTNSARNEALEMAAIAGVTAEPRRYELQPVDGDTFMLIDSAGVASHAVEFLGRDTAGRARFLNSGRAAPRIGDTQPEQIGPE